MDMGIGEIIFVSLVALMFFAIAFKVGKQRGPSAPSENYADELARRKAQEDIARLREIAEYDRWGSGKK